MGRAVGVLGRYDGREIGVETARGRSSGDRAISERCGNGVGVALDPLVIGRGEAGGGIGCAVKVAVCALVLFAVDGVIVGHQSVRGRGAVLIKRNRALGLGEALG